MRRINIPYPQGKPLSQALGRNWRFGSRRVIAASQRGVYFEGLSGCELLPPNRNQCEEFANMSRQNTRRDFLKTTALAGVGYWVAGGVQAKESTSALEEIRFACIGVGGKGTSDANDAGRNGKVVAICDVDERTLDKAAQTFSKDRQGVDAKKYNDFRKMLDEMGSSIDAVTISTPDHTHAPAATMAMRMGKHCFCQKPLTHGIYEARRLGEIAREQKVATQMGNQGTAGGGLRKGAALIKAGALGEVSEIHVWTNRPVWAQGGERPKEAPVPSHVHWDLWIGPAPYRPYANGYHPFAWRGWWDFGTGALGDMACHTLNLPFMGLNLRDPVSVQAETSGHNGDSYPKWSIITFEFPALSGRGPVKMTWYDGSKRPDKSLLDGKDPAGSGSLVIGSKGKLYSPGDYGGSYQLLGGAEEKSVTFESSPGHFTEFARAIKGGPAAVSNFPDYAGPLTETILLGNLAVWAASQPGQPGKKIEWDAKNLKATNAPEVQSIVRREYREGYTI
jgi:predicted dehydrogenase